MRDSDCVDTIHGIAELLSVSNDIVQVSKALSICKSSDSIEYCS